MVKHIVLFNVKKENSVDDMVKIMRENLLPLVGQIEGLNYAEVGRNFAGADITLYCELESREALAYYADHPLHAEAKSKFFPMLSGRTAADYEV